MSNYFFPTRGAIAVTGYGEVTNDDASLELVTASEVTVNIDRFRSDTRYLHLEKITFSVYSGAEGGGGLFRIQSTEGTVIFTIDANNPYPPITLDWGPNGTCLPANEGLQIIVYNAAITNASVSVSFVGHISYDPER